MNDFLKDIDEKIIGGFLVLALPTIIIFMLYGLIKALNINIVSLIILAAGALVCWTVGHFTIVLLKKIDEKENKIK